MILSLFVAIIALITKTFETMPNSTDKKAYHRAAM